jgi:hypothetical protein
MDVDAIIRTLAVVYLIVSVNLTAYGLCRLLRGPSVPQLVRPPFYSTFISLLGLITAVLYLFFYIFKDDYINDYNGAIRPLVGIISLLVLAIIWSTRRSIRVSARGLEVQYIFKKDRIIPWKEIDNIGRDVMSGTLVVNTHFGRQLSFADSWDNLDRLWDVAESKQVILRRMDATGVGHVTRMFKSTEDQAKSA